MGKKIKPEEAAWGENETSSQGQDHPTPRAYFHVFNRYDIFQSYVTTVRDFVTVGLGLKLGDLLQYLCWPLQINENLYLLGNKFWVSQNAT